MTWKNTVRSTLTLLVAGTIIAGCASNNAPNDPLIKDPAASNATKSNQPSSNASVIDEQPSSVYYEIFVRAFADSNGDGIGDLNGLIDKLDYLNDGNPATDSDLGIEGIWLMPINPSPSYHGYDVTDYYTIHPEYGTVEDMKRLMEEAHKRGIKVIMDLVVNHSSTQHPWFVDSAKGTDSPYRDWYVWAEDQGREVSGASATNGGNAWHQKNDNHYLGVFWDGMPDLNFDNAEVRQEMIKIGKFWLDQGLDGFRIDAAKHIYEDLQSDRNGETTEKNVLWWQEFRTALQEVNKDVYLIGEVAENSPVPIAPYLNGGFDSGFNFGLAQSLLSIAGQEEDTNLASSLNRTHGMFTEVSEGQFVDAPFLTNHDQNRTMSILGGNIDQAKMAAAMLLTMPGNPFLYYGEEIGMFGQKPDEVIREPFIWNADGKSGNGQTSWIASQFNTTNPPSVEAQQNDPNSLLSHYKKMIRIRASHAALRDGAIESFETENSAVVGFYRTTASEKVLVLHNVSKEAQEINVAADTGMKEIADSVKDGASYAAGKVKLPPYSTVIIK
ncbi:alpha-amylase family glycosyl hydrolase [Paenibacillus plantiphilus]|nr:alpha-amylase family glycosyl hydrolase [Paenibacillus plantiphilus]